MTPLPRCGFLPQRWVASVNAGEPGFALVVTLSLMILLVLLAVSLLGLSSIALRTSSASMDQATARANARLALQIAIGELQKAAGADQRVTAMADILTGDKLPTAGKAKWTGAWDVTNPDSAITPVWLVSGRSTPSDTATQDSICLVGDGSTDTSSQGNQVMVPLQTVNSQGGANPDGAYGWWIGDEGVKARVNLSDPNFNLTTKQEWLNRQAAPGVTAINKLTGLTGATVDTTLNTAMAKGLSNSELQLVSNKITPSLLRSLFHDAGTYSQGINANIREGGLKRDLSRGLYDVPPSAVVTGNVFSVVYPDGSVIGPNWDIVRSWARELKVDTTKNFPTAPFVRPHRESNQFPNDAIKKTAQHGVGPIISRWGMEWWVRMESVPSDSAASGSTYTVGVGLRPVLQLTNPYNVRLPQTAYRLSFNNGFDLPNAETGYDGDGSGFRWQVGTKIIELPYSYLLGLPESSPFLYGMGMQYPIRPWFHFTTPPVSIEPGQTLVFTPNTNNWWGPLYTDRFNPLDLGLNSSEGSAGKGVLRLNCKNNDPSKTVTYEELHPSNSDPISPFRFGENVGLNNGVWPLITDNTRGGRNHVIQLEIHNSNDTPTSLLPDLGSVISRIERRGMGKFEATSWAYNEAQNWVGTNDQMGRRVFVFDYVLGNALPTYTETGAVPACWCRDYNLRFHYPCTADGRPMVNGNSEGANGDPWRDTGLWAFTEGEPDWHSEIKPMETGQDTHAVFWGNARLNADGAQARIVLYDLPCGEILSPGQLQHVNLGGRDRPWLYPLGTNDFSVMRNRGAVPGVDPGRPGGAAVTQPTYIVGNSYSDKAVPIGDLQHDWSWVANREIWDRWFVSGIPGDASPGGALSQTQLSNGELRNPRMKPLPGAVVADIQNIDKAASKLLVQGMFNLNSTSVEAWKALLGSTANGASVVAGPRTGGAAGSTTTFDPTSGRDTLARYARTLITNHAMPIDTTLGNDSRWSGPVQLSDKQLTDLAAGIVQRIKNQTAVMNRPFASLSEFINRPADKDLGLLQETFDQSKLPDLSNLTGGRLNGVTDQGFLGEFHYHTSGPGTPVTLMEPQGAPGALRQGDFLQAVGSFINVRSDTFRIRAYGEKRSGSGANMVVTARAWCEAIVQRLPDYIDPADVPEIKIPPPPAASPLKVANQKFGRRFVIQSFRWLDPSEI